MVPNITDLYYILETHQALESHAMKHYLEPQTENRLDTFPLDDPDALETPDVSYVGISHIVLLQWDTPVGYSSEPRIYLVSFSPGESIFTCSPTVWYILPVSGHQHMFVSSKKNKRPRRLGIRISGELTGRINCLSGTINFTACSTP
jgi:hypothetical protein